MAKSERTLLKTFPNPEQKRDYIIHMEIPEFTSLCPLSGQPDFANFELDYIADKVCVELKSLKLYMGSYRNKKAFHEKLTNKIVSDFVSSINPRFIRLKGKFFVRGGIFTNILVEHKAEGWKQEEIINLPHFHRQNSYLG